MRICTLLTLLVALFLWSCENKTPTERNKEPAAGDGGETSGADDDGEPLPDDVATTHSVMVIDDGFDTTHPVFAGKVSAKYTISCTDDSDDDEDEPTTLEEIKTALISSYSSATSDCSLEEDIDFELPSEFADVENLRTEWNEIIESKSSGISDDKFEELYEIITGQRTKDNFHGTNTSSLIAYDNKNVKLVLVQMELGSASDALIDDETACPEQDDIDLWVEAHSDAEVMEAHKTAPVDDLVKQLIEIVESESITLLNLSLGKFSSAGLAEKLAEEGCGTLDFSEQYRVDGELTRAREVYRIENNLYGDTEYLTVQAAGNEGRKIDDYNDAAECSDPELGLVLAGSYDLDGEISNFSNYGNCVDYFTLGSNVVVAAPDGFLDIANGTSFSAPLLVRHITKKYDASESYANIITGLSASAGSDKKLPAEAFPTEVAFESNDEITIYALTQKQKTPAMLYAMPLERRRVRALRLGLASPSFVGSW